MVRDADEKNFAKDVADFSDARTMGPAGVHIFNSINFSIAPGPAARVPKSCGLYYIWCDRPGVSNFPAVRSNCLRPDIFVVLHI